MFCLIEGKNFGMSTLMMQWLRAGGMPSLSCHHNGLPRDSMVAFEVGRVCQCDHRAGGQLERDQHGDLPLAGYTPRDAAK